MPAPPALRGLVETAWVLDGPGGAAHVLPDGCMDLIAMGGRVMVAGPDTAAHFSHRDAESFAGLRFRPGVLPRLLGVPADALRDQRVPLDEVCRVRSGALEDVVADLMTRPSRAQTTPWTLPAVHHVTARLARGAAVTDVARDVGWSARTLQRQSAAVYGYGPATLRRILRFRRAVELLRAGHSTATVAATAGYADEPHLHREAREFSGVALRALSYASAANRSTDVPSGSATVA
jgi:AraC-like DNA-binding protein